MLTLDFYRQKKYLIPWELAEGELPQRNFFYTEKWQKAMQALEANKKRRSLTLDLSPRGRVEGTVRQFVKGVDYEKLVRNIGYAMSPPFKRMRNKAGIGAPLTGIERVAYMRTEQTRTFGFFHATNTFCAVSLEHVVALKERDGSKGDLLYRHHAEGVLRFISRLRTDQINEKDNPENLVTP